MDVVFFSPEKKGDLPRKDIYIYTYLFFAKKVMFGKNHHFSNERLEDSGLVYYL